MALGTARLLPTPAWQPARRCGLCVCREACASPTLASQKGDASTHAASHPPSPLQMDAKFDRMNAKFDRLEKKIDGLVAASGPSVSLRG